MAIAGAIARFVEMPRGTLSIKLTPQGQSAGAATRRRDEDKPAARADAFQVDAGNGR
jgi:hypothetical protein